MNYLKPQEGLKYLIYSRVSVKGTHETAKESSIPMQEELCRRFVTDHKGIIHDTISDEFASGKELMKRPGMYRIMLDLESGNAEWDTIIAYSLSRFSRSMKDLQRLFELINENKKYIVSLVEMGLGRAMKSVWAYGFGVVGTIEF